MPFQTLADVFLLAAAQHKPDQFLHKVAGEYRPISTAEWAGQVRAAAAALAGLGVAPGDRVALMADNGPHWPTVDFATLCLGAATVPIYPTLLAETAAYIVRDSGAKVVVVHRPEQLAGLLAHRGELPEVRRFVLVEGDGTPDGETTRYAELLAAGVGADPEAFEARARRVSPGDLASLVYTSGTTGMPKGVMLTHGNFVANVATAIHLLDLRSEDTALSFLPLSHVFERTVNYCYYAKGLTIAYAESVQTVAQNLLEVRPHLFVSVPRVYEKVLSRVRENVARGSAVQQRIFRWAEGVGREALSWRIDEDHPPGWLGLQLALADGLVFGKIRERLGGRFRFAVSGGAPLAREVAEFFWGAGIPIYEGYGLTETAPVLAVNVPGGTRLGTVGRPIPGVEIALAADGEILARGPNVMAGYYRHPEATAEVIDAEGWFHTGDVGELDADGFLRITDRKKELIVNAYGKNVAPAPIENALKAGALIGQAMVVGDRRKFLAALLVPDFEVALAWAAQHGIALPPDAQGRAALVADARLRAAIAEEVAEVNRHLAHFEQIVAWELLPDEFTIESGELTPTQKVKRRVVLARHAEAIERLYERSGGD